MGAATVKTTTIPYSDFKAEKNGGMTLLVPDYATSFGSAADYIETISGLEILSADGGMSVDKGATIEARELLFERSPRIMRFSKPEFAVYIKENGGRKIRYLRWDEDRKEAIKPESELDYVLGKIAAARYVGCSEKELTQLVKTYGIAVFKRKGYGIKCSQFESNVDAYLLRDLNTVKGKKAKKKSGKKKEKKE